MLYCCRHCRQEKDETMFYEYDNTCKRCIFDNNNLLGKKESYKKRRKQNYVRKMSNPDYRDNYNKRYRDATAKRHLDNEYRQRVLADRVLRNHKTINRPIEISVSEYLKKRANTKFCVIDGKPFSLDYKNGPEMDMIDPKGPLNIENIRFICKRHNEMKSDMSDRELFEHCKAIMEFQKNIYINNPLYLQ